MGSEMCIRDSYRPLRTISDRHAFIQHRHDETVEKLQKCARQHYERDLSKRWYLQSEWLDMVVVKQVAQDMVNPFVWRWGEKYPPRGHWEWKFVYVTEEEAETVIAHTMEAFLSADADEIREAARWTDYR